MINETDIKACPEGHKGDVTDTSSRNDALQRRWNKRRGENIFILLVMAWFTAHSQKTNNNMTSGFFNTGNGGAAQSGGVQGGGAQDGTGGDGGGGGVRSPEGPARVVFQSDVAFNGGGPVCFTGAPGVSARVLIVAARAGGAGDLMTLVDAPSPSAARIRTVAADGFGPEGVTDVERSLAGQVMPWLGGWTIVTLDLGQPVPLEDLYVGDAAPGLPEWRRGWQGDIAEAVMLDAWDADVAAGVANYLSIRWGIGYPCQFHATAAQRRTAVDAGLRNYGLAWATRIIVR